MHEEPAIEDNPRSTVFCHRGNSTRWTSALPPKCAFAYANGRTCGFESRLSFHGGTVGRQISRIPLADGPPVVDQLHAVRGVVHSEGLAARVSSRPGRLHARRSNQLIADLTCYVLNFYDFPSFPFVSTALLTMFELYRLTHMIRIHAACVFACTALLTTTCVRMHSVTDRV